MQAIPLLLAVSALFVGFLLLFGVAAVQVFAAVFFNQVTLKGYLLHPLQECVSSRSRLVAAHMLVVWGWASADESCP
jgi:hypothetical protein